MAELPPDEVRQAAWRMARRGDMAGAEAHLALARLHDADRGEGWFATGLLRLGRGGHARAAFLAAARARFPEGALRDRMLDRLRNSSGRYDALDVFYDDFAHDFCCFAVPRSVRPDERQAYGYCLDRACVFLGPTEAARLLEGERATNGETVSLHVNLGHVGWLAGRRDEADAHYLRAREIAARDGLKPFHFNSGTLVWLARDAARALIGAPPAASAMTHRFAQPRAGPADLVVVVGCDAAYFVFLPKLLLSIATAHRRSASALRIAVHCNLADPNERQADFLRHAARSIGAACPLISLGWSIGAAKFRDPSWYTGLRYLVLGDVMAHHRCGIVALDVDCELLPGFFDAAPRLLSHDFAFRMYTFDAEFRQVGGEPWSIGAHPTYIADTGAGRRFAGFIAAYLHAAYDPSLPTCWTIDQCAIAQGYDLIVRPDPSLRVLNLAREPPGYRLPDEDGGKGGFLHAGGMVTMDDFSARLTAAL